MLLSMPEHNHNKRINAVVVAWQYCTTRLDMNLSLVNISSLYFFHRKHRLYWQCLCVQRKVICLKMRPPPNANAFSLKVIKQEGLSKDFSECTLFDLLKYNDVNDDERLTKDEFYTAFGEYKQCFVGNRFPCDKEKTHSEFWNTADSRMKAAACDVSVLMFSIYVVWKKHWSDETETIFSSAENKSVFLIPPHLFYNVSWSL